MMCAAGPCSSMLPRAAGPRCVELLTAVPSCQRLRCAALRPRLACRLPAGCTSPGAMGEPLMVAVGRVVLRSERSAVIVLRYLMRTSVTAFKKRNGLDNTLPHRTATTHAAHHRACLDADRDQELHRVRNQLKLHSELLLPPAG